LITTAAPEKSKTLCFHFSRKTANGAVIAEIGEKRFQKEQHALCIKRFCHPPDEPRLMMKANRYC